MNDKFLDWKALLATARQETGLHEFDGPPVEEPLERLTHALRTEARLNDVGIHVWHARILGTEGSVHVAPAELWEYCASGLGIEPDLSSIEQYRTA